MKQKHSIQEIKEMNIIWTEFVLSHTVSKIDFKKSEIHHFYNSLKAFNFPDEAAVAEHHFKELGRELNIQVQEENKSSEAGSEPNKPTQIEIEVWSSHEIMIRVP